MPVDHLIMSIHQPHVRPTVRGKSSAKPKEIFDRANFKNAKR